MKNKSIINHRFLKGIISGYSAIFLNIVVSLILIPLTLNYITKPEYGVFVIIGDLLTWFVTANLGITTVFNAKGSHLIGSKNYLKLNKVFNTTLFSQIISSTLLIFVGFYLCYNPEILFDTSDLVEDVKLVILILFCGFFIQYNTQPLNSLLISDKQIHIDNYLKLGLILIQASITIILLMNDFKLLSLAISSFISNVIIAAVTWYRVIKKFPQISISIMHWESYMVKFLLKHGIWFTLGSIAGLLLTRTDSFLIGKFISLSTVTFFAINYKLYQISEKLHAIIFNTLRPYFAQVYGKKDFTVLKYMFNISFFISFLLAFLLGSLVYFFSEIFIFYWVGESFYLGKTINILLCMNFIIQSSILPHRILLATSLYKTRDQNLIRLLDGILKILISLIAIKLFGIKGLIISSIISSYIVSHIFMNIFSSSLLKDKWYTKFFFIAPVFSLITVIFIKSILIVIFIFIAVFLLQIYLNNRFINKGNFNIKYLKTFYYTLK